MVVMRCQGERCTSGLETAMQRKKTPTIRAWVEGEKPVTTLEG